MKQILDFIPLIVFFALYKLYDIYLATGALIAATAIQLVVTYALYKKVEKIQLITFVIVTIFGGMTLFLPRRQFYKVESHHHLRDSGDWLSSEPRIGKISHQRYARQGNYVT